jgi:WD40 repeat protein
LLEEIARGGMGVVYKARQVSLGRIVAVKMLLFGPNARPEDIKRFRLEASAAAALQHPNIVAVHEVGVNADRQYLVMDYVDGPTLAELIASQPLPAMQAAGYLKTVAEAIHYAHEQGILHRDLKPSNVLIDSSDQPRVTDFGLAKRLTNSQLLSTNLPLTLSGQVIGSLNYMAPEQAAAKPGQVSRTTDVYALGATLYHLLTGRPPFAGENLAETLRQVIHVEPPSPRVLNPGVLRDVETICLKCLQKEPRRRYQTAQELADELARVLRLEPIHARRASAVEKAWRWCQRNRLAFAAIVAVAATLTIGIVTSTWQAVRATRATKEAERLLYVADMDLAHRLLQEGNIRGAEFLLAAHELKPGGEDLRGFEWFALKRLCRGDQLFTFPPQAYVPLCVAFSPDGRLLAMGNGNRRPLQGVNSPSAASRVGELKLFDLATKREVITFPRQMAWITSIAFARDGQTLAAGSSDGTITLWNLTGHKLADLPTHNLESVTALRFSPNGQVLASGSSDGTLTLWSTESRRQGWSTQLGRSTPTLAFAPDGSRWAGAANGAITLVEISATNRLDVPWPATAVTSVAFSPDGKTLAVANVNTWVRLLDLDSLATNRPNIANLGQHHSEVSSVAFFPDGNVVSASCDHTLKLWDVGRLKEVSTLRGHRGAVRQVAVSPEGTTIASVSDDRTVRLWSREPAPEADVLIHPRWVHSADFSPDGKWLVTGCGDGNIRLWDIASSQCIRTFRGHTNGVPRVLFSKDSKLVISGRDDEMIKIWNVINPREEPLAILKGHHGTVFCLCLSSDGRTLVSANGNWGEETNPGFVKFWAFPKGNEIGSFLAHTNGIHCMAISPDGRLLVTGSWDTTIKLWDFGSRKPLAELNGHNQPVTALAFSPDGKTLVSGCEAGKLIFWNVATRQKLNTVDEVATLDGLVFSGDGRTLVETYVNTVRLRNVVTLKELLTLHGHEAFVFTPVISPDGRVLATPSADGTVRLWPAARFSRDTIR